MLLKQEAILLSQRSNLEWTWRKWHLEYVLKNEEEINRLKLYIFGYVGCGKSFTKKKEGTDAYTDEAVVDLQEFQ